MNEWPNIYVTKGISLKEKTDEDWEFGLKKHNLAYKKEISLEKYKDFEKMWHRGSYNYLIYDYNHAFFTDKENATKSVVRDMGGMNEAGSYNYAAVLEIPTGVSYAEMTDIISIEFYEYNRESEKYEVLKDDKIRDVLISYFQLEYLFEKNKDDLNK
jgi:hypothetical protein